MSLLGLKAPVTLAVLESLGLSALVYTRRLRVTYNTSPKQVNRRILQRLPYWRGQEISRFYLGGIAPVCFSVWELRSLLELKALVAQAYSVHLIGHYQYMIPQLPVAWVLGGLMPVAKAPSLALDEALRP